MSMLLLLLFIQTVPTYSVYNAPSDSASLMTCLVIMAATGVRHSNLTCGKRTD